MSKKSPKTSNNNGVTKNNLLWVVPKDWEIEMWQVSHGQSNVANAISTLFGQANFPILALGAPQGRGTYRPDLNTQLTKMASEV